MAHDDPIDAGELAEILHDITADGTNGGMATPWRNLSGENQERWVDTMAKALLAAGYAGKPASAVTAAELARAYYETHSGPGTWKSMASHRRGMHIQEMIQALKQYAEEHEGPSTPAVQTPYLFGQVTVEAAREMLERALADLTVLHTANCSKGDPANCEHPGYRNQAVKLQHALGSLPVKQPAQPTEAGTVVRITVNAETHEARWFRLHPQGGWMAFGVTAVIPWESIIELAQRHRVTAEIVWPTQG